MQNQQSLYTLLHSEIENYLLTDKKISRSEITYAIKNYQTCKNIKGLNGVVHYFFKDQGKERAIRYLVAINSIRNDNDLLMFIHNDIEIGKMGSSRRLKGRFLQALCTHLNISKSEIDEGVRQRLVTMVSYPGFHSAPHIDEPEVRRRVMLDKIYACMQDRELQVFNMV